MTQREQFRLIPRTQREQRAYWQGFMAAVQACESPAFARSIAMATAEDAIRRLTADIEKQGRDGMTPAPTRGAPK